MGAGVVVGWVASLPLCLRLLFIIHRADLSVGDGALREEAPAGRTSSSSRSVQTRRRFSFPCALPLFFSFPFAPVRACNSHILRADIWRHSLSASSPSLLCHKALIHGASAGGGREVWLRHARPESFPCHTLSL